VRALLAVIPAEERKLVTEHDNMGYFARAYGFKVIGSVIPSFSTMATISAQEMVTLQRQIVGEGVAAIFVGSTVNPRLAEQVGHDVGVKVAPLFTDSLSAPGMGAANYVEMMRSNAKTIAEALTSP
jgi:zinc/manganese transport system substrate-binding protein